MPLDASGSFDPDADPLTYSWDINGDGVFGDATGATPTLSWEQLQALGINDNDGFAVTVQVRDIGALFPDGAATRSAGGA